MWYEQKSATWSNIWVYLWCSWHILMSCVLYYWTHSWQLGIYLSHPKKSNKILFFVLIKKELSRRLPHFDELVKISIWCNLLGIQNEQTHWLLYESESDWLWETMQLSDLNWAPWSYNFNNYLVRLWLQSWGPFLESPENVSGPKSHS